MSTKITSTLKKNLAVESCIMAFWWSPGVKELNAGPKLVSDLGAKYLDNI